jgi:hypothetical protein
MYRKNFDPLVTSINFRWVKYVKKLRDISFISQNPKTIVPHSIFMYILIIMPCRRSCRKNIDIHLYKAVYLDIYQEYQKKRLVFIKNRASLEHCDYETARELDYQIKKLDLSILKYGVNCGKCSRSSTQAAKK